jgi:polysaccharide chain length determinant protein (PEP-CTERM system associated)
MRDLLRDDRPPLRETLGAMLREGRRRLVPMAVLFALIALTAIAVGWNWPKKYHSASTILVSEDKTIQKLLEGRAAPTSVTDRAMIAREVIFGSKVMEAALREGGWLADEPSPGERARIADMIQSRTVIGAPRENLIRIEYWDTDAARAQRIAQLFADRFMAESREAQMRESREAYEFIAGEAARYETRLAEAEARLEAFRERHPEARALPPTVMESRLASLRQRLASDEARLLEDARVRLGAVQQARSADPLAARRAQLEDELADKRQRYTDAHPDVSRLQRQLDDLRLRALAAPAPQPVAAVADSGALRARIAATEREIAAETERLQRSASPTPELAELIREQEVARDLYNDLLRRLEYARLSMNLDEEGRGLDLRLHEAAALPARPTGLRFAHFALGGMAAAFALPLALLFVFVKLDPHLRAAGAVQRRTGLPVLADVPSYWTRHDQRLLLRDARVATAFVLLASAAVVAACVVKLVQAP